jgi:mannose-6-phosphate isomerase
MSAIRLSTIRVDKPWGRMKLWPGFENPASGADPVGEIWFDAPAGQTPELMVKYLFTSERLSIQVHPNDDQARARGYPCGKDEAWVILAAEPDSTIALGTVRPVAQADLRAAALDGSIEALMDWRAAKAGDVIYSPAQTVHAIGAGITLIEVQQNVDCTYRLYDYGRPRELHLEDGIAVSDPVPFVEPQRSAWKFAMERVALHGAQNLALASGTPGWLIPVAGAGTVDGAPFQAGECWQIEGETQISGEADLLIASAKPFAFA